MLGLMQRWLTAIEIAGFGAIAVGGGGFAYLASGLLSGLSAFSVIAGVVAIYEARAFAASVELPPAEKDKTNA